MRTIYTCGENIIWVCSDDIIEGGVHTVCIESKSKCGSIVVPGEIERCTIYSNCGCSGEKISQGNCFAVKFTPETKLPFGGASISIKQDGIEVFKRDYFVYKRVPQWHQP